MSLLAAIAMLAWLGAALPAAAFGPPPNAPLSLEKLSPIDEFLNAQVAQGEIPGAVVLIQRHGKPVYFKWFGKTVTDFPADDAIDRCSYAVENHDRTLCIRQKSPCRFRPVVRRLQSRSLPAPRDAS
jgi:hypothetical protein